MTERENEFYELISLDSGNIVSDFAAIDEALEAVRQAANAYGWETVRRFTLMRVCGDEQDIVAMKQDLVDLARSQAPETSAVR